MEIGKKGIAFSSSWLLFKAWNVRERERETWNNAVSFLPQGFPILKWGKSSLGEPYKGPLGSWIAICLSHKIEVSSKPASYFRVDIGTRPSCKADP